MFIAIRDLWWARGRFALMGGVVALLALLIVLLTGLSTGLVDDNVSGIRSLPATHLSFSAETGVNFNRSTVERAQWEAARRRAGVRQAVPLGNTLFNGQAYRDAATAKSARAEILADGKSRTKGTAVDLALFGVEPGAFVAPVAESGEPLGGRPDGVVVSSSLLDKGVHLGDTIVLDRVGTVVTVVGVTDKDNYGHVPVVWAPLPLWQEATFGPPGGPPPGEKLSPGVYDLATVVAQDVDAGVDATAGDATSGLLTVDREAAFAGSPGYKEETGTLTMIQVFLYAISALLVGAFFAVWTIQRRGEVALVKALGASNRYLLVDALGQAVIVLVAATAVGVVLGFALGAVLPGGAPFSLQPAPVLLAAALVVVMGLVGGALSIRRITRVDPITALGAAR